MNYYYFAATLPGLYLESPPPFLFKRFRELCAEYLCPHDREALEALADPAARGCAHPFVRRWKEVETSLANAIARMRAGRTKRDATPFLSEKGEFDARAERAVSEAYSKINPVDREMAIDRFRWNRIEELAGFSPFAGSAVLAYGLKLKLCERWAALDDEKGRQRVEELVGYKLQM